MSAIGAEPWILVRSKEEDKKRKEKKRGEEEYNGKRKNRETMRIWFFFPGL